MRSFSITAALLSTQSLFSSTNAFTISTPITQQKSVGSSITSRNMIVDPNDFLASSNLVADVSAAASEVGQASYSKASYYTTLGLYVMSFPGLWSQVKRSTTAKMKRKTYLRLVPSSFACFVS